MKQESAAVVVEESKTQKPQKDNKSDKQPAAPKQQAVKDSTKMIYKAKSNQSSDQAAEKAPQVVAPMAKVEFPDLVPGAFTPHQDF